MRIKDIFEAPIHDLEIHTDPSFDPTVRKEIVKPRDVGPIEDKKGVEKIRRQWEKTPWDFNVYIVKVSKGPVSNYLNSETVQKLIKNRDKDKITIIYTQNLTNERNYMPFTGWILAHRLGHVFQFEKVRKQKYVSEKSAKIYKEFVGLVHDLLGYGRGGQKKREEVVSLDRDKTKAHNLLTTRSARKGKISSPLDIDAELLAQFLITGKIKLNTEDPKEKEIEEQMNQKLTELFNSLTGSVLVF